MEHLCFPARAADPIKKHPGCYKIDWALLPVRMATTALMAMCKYCGGVIGRDSNPNLSLKFNVLI